jgi:ABC-type uncharacterized transport system permease subunit
MTAAVQTPAPTEEFLPEKKKPRGDTWLVSLLAVLVSLVVGALLMIFSDSGVQGTLSYVFNSPGDFFSQSWHVVSSAYTAMFDGAVFNTANDGTANGIFGPISQTVYTATPLICAALGIALAFRSGLFNIGGQGQLILGATVAAVLGFDVHLPPVLHWIVAIVGGVAAGGAWGLLVGFLKARSGAHEVITTIMLNYVAANGLMWVIQLKGVQQPGNPQASKLVDTTARLPVFAGTGSSLKFDFSIVLMLLAALFVWWLLSRSTVGFRLRAVGANPAAARTAGMNVGGNTMLAMLLAGGLAGLGGTILVLGGTTSYQLTPNITANVGFDAITVALLGRNNPWGTVLAGLLIGGLQAGGRYMSLATGVPIDIATVIEAVIVIFIAAPRLVRAVFRLRGTGAALAGATTNLAVTISGAARRVRVPRNVAVGSVQAVLGVAALVLFGLGSRAGGHAIVQFSVSGDAINLGSVSFPARPVLIVLCALAVVAGGLRLLDRLGGRWAASLSTFGLVTAFSLWSVAGSPDGLNIVSLLSGSLFPAAIPLILGGLAGVIGERAGVVNVALEGQILLGAFVAAVLGSVTHSPWLGALGGALAGLLVALALAVLAIRYLVDQVIIGVVLDLFVLGITNFLYQKLLASSSNATSLNQPSSFPVWKIPVLGDIPIIGDVFFNGTIFLYLTYVLVAVVHFGLFHTRWGLRIRSVGEHPKAADTVGIKVARTRYRAVWVAGLIAGLAGAMLVIGSGLQSTFTLDMSSGKGYIALAAVIFGRWRPGGVVAAALLFGFAQQLGNLLSSGGAPIDSSLLATAPYLATIIAVAGLAVRSRPPAADGQPYLAG